LLVFFGFRVNLQVSNEFPAAQFPKYKDQELKICNYTCKKEATSANAH